MSEEIETLWELKKDDFYVECVKGANGIYFALYKNGNAMMLTLDEAYYLRTLIMRAIQHAKET